MEWTGPGFVDHHAHLLRAAGLIAESWGSTEAIRALHEFLCATWRQPGRRDRAA